MGVPQYFHWLVKNHSDILLNDRYEYGRPEYLFLDFNCAIHPASKKANMTTFEDIFASVCEYLRNILTMVNPSIMVYIAIDGVAPMAKMKQQRIRRYKSIYENEKKSQIERKFGNYKKPLFDFNMISPGTDFMNQLSIELNKYIKILNEKEFSGLEIILDDSNNPGEGEHKIMNYLNKNISSNSKVVIYGLDSDLIFLTLLNYRKDIVLFREKIIFNQINQNNQNDTIDTEYQYFDINNMIRCIEELMLNKNMIDNNILNSKQNKLIRDYMGLSVLLGNDFLPSLSNLKIKDGGFDKMITYYHNIRHMKHKDEYLMTDDGYNYIFLKELFYNISSNEINDYLEQDKLRQSRIDKYKSHKKISNYENAIKDLQYVEHYTIDKLKLGQDNWKSRYYRYYLGQSNNNKLRNYMIKKFVEGMLWMYRYYIKNINCWFWYYPFNASPLSSDIYKYLDINGSKVLDIDFSEYEDKMLCPEEQLLMILPPQSSNLLSDKLSKLLTNSDSPIIGQYPVNFELDYQRHRYLWECYPILPKIDIEMTRRIYKTIKY